MFVVVNIWNGVVCNVDLYKKEPLELEEIDKDTGNGDYVYYVKEVNDE